MCQEDGEKEEESEMQQCCNVLVLAESMEKRQKEDKEEKKAQLNLCTIHAKCVITIPKDLQQMKPSLPLLNEMPPLWMMRLKDKA